MKVFALFLLLLLLLATKTGRELLFGSFGWFISIGLWIIIMIIVAVVLMFSSYSLTG